jgi:O-antigen ligase
MIWNEASGTRFQSFFNYLILSFLALFLALSPWFYGLTPFKDQLVVQLFLFGLSLFFLIVRDPAPLFKWHIHEIDFWIFLSLVISFLYVLFSVIPYRSLLAFLKFAAVVAFYWLIRNNANTDRKYLFMLWTILLSGVFYSGYGLLQYYGFLSKSFWYQPGSLASRYINGGHFAAFLIFPIWVGLSFMVSARKWFLRFTVFFLLLLLLWALVLTRARTVWAAFLLGMSCFIAISYRTKFLKAKALLALFLCLLLAGWILFQMGVMDDVWVRIREIWLMKFYSLNYRLNLWRGSWLAIADRPWGWGLGTFSAIFPQYAVSSDRFFVNYAHNEFLQVGVDLGIFGILLLLGFLLVYFRKAVSFLKDGNIAFPKKALGAAFVSLLVGIAFSSLADFPLRIYATSFFFAAFVALSVSVFGSAPAKVPPVPPKEVSPRFGRYLFRIIGGILIFAAGSLAARQLFAQMVFKKAQRLEADYAWNKAEKEYQKAIHLAPLYPGYYEALGTLYRQRAVLSLNRKDRKYYRQKAIEIYEEIVRLQPYDAYSRFVLALLYEKLKDINRAKNEFAKAASLEPLNPVLAIEYGYFAARNSFVEEAITAFESFNKNPFPGDVSQKADPCEILKKCYPITQDYGQLKRIIPDNWRGHQCLGLILGEDGRWDIAKTEFDLAEKNLEKDAPIAPLDNVMVEIANFYVSHNRLHEALEIYQEALARSPEDGHRQNRVQELSEKLGLAKNTAVSS